MSKQALADAMRIDELRGHIKTLHSLRVQAVPGGEAEREIDALIFKKEQEIKRLEGNQ